MTHIARIQHLIAGVAFASVTLLTAPAAFAQETRTPNVVGPVGQYQTVRPNSSTRPLREGVTGLGSETQGVIREPRFIVEAVRFKAVDESGRTDLTSDEVFAVFRSGEHSMITEVYDDVDSSDVESFEAGQSCIWPVADTSQRGERTWACSTEGGRGPISFHIELYDLDPNVVDRNILGRFCIPIGWHGNTDPCITRHSSQLFNADFSYGVSEILGRLDPECRCFEETASQSMDNATYEVTFRITRVDTGGEPLGVDGNADTAGPIVYRSGTLSAVLNQGFEFDGGSVVNAGSDFTFSRTGFATFLLTPNGGAKIWQGGGAARGYAACFAARDTASYVTTTVTPMAGQHACYVTNDGRVGEFRVDSLTQGANPALTVTFTTWQ